MPGSGDTERRVSFQMLPFGGWKEMRMGRHRADASVSPDQRVALYASVIALVGSAVTTAGQFGLPMSFGSNQQLLWCIWERSTADAAPALAAPTV